MKIKCPICGEARGNIRFVSTENTEEINIHTQMINDYTEITLQVEGECKHDWTVLIYKEAGNIKLNIQS